MKVISKVGFAVFVLLVVLIYGCTTIQVQPKPIEQTQVQNQTLAPVNPCSSSETFFPNFIEGYECQSTSEVKACEDGGGNWRLFGNGCGDSCGEKPRSCTQAFQAACDCGISKCWGIPPPCKIDTLSGAQVCRVVLNVESPSCIDDTYEPYTTPQEACKATQGNWTYYGGGCNPTSTGQKCRGISGTTCGRIDTNPEVGCRFRDSNKTLLPPSSPAPYPDAMGECYALACFSQGVKCVCPAPLTFGLQGCTNNSNNFIEPKQLMSITGGWN